jgi:excisionase family DNA binding protein
MNVGKSRNGSRTNRRRSNNTTQRRSRTMAYSIQRLAKVVGVGRSTLYAEIAAGRLIAQKVGRRTIVTRANVTAWLRGLPNLLSRGEATR